MRTCETRRGGGYEKVFSLKMSGKEFRHALENMTNSGNSKFKHVSTLVENAVTYSGGMLTPTEAPRS